MPEEQLKIRPGTAFQLQLIHVTPSGGTMRLWAVTEETYHMVAESLGNPHSEMYVPAQAMIKAHDDHIAEAVVLNHEHDH